MKRSKSAISVVATVALSLSACAVSSHTPTSGTTPENWLADGSILISRPAPAQGSLLGGASALGFMPTISHSELSFGSQGEIVIDITAGTLSLMRNGKVSQVATIKAASNLAGTFTVAHKQENPLWYAPTKYFTDRDLPVPAEGDKDRFLRGALGDRAVFLNNLTPIHTGQLGLSDVGGIQVDSETMAKLYPLLSSGMPVQIK